MRNVFAVKKMLHFPDILLYYDLETNESPSFLVGIFCKGEGRKGDRNKENDSGHCTASVSGELSA